MLSSVTVSSAIVEMHFNGLIIDINSLQPVGIAGPLTNKYHNNLIWNQERYI